MTFAAVPAVKLYVNTAESSDENKWIIAFPHLTRELNTAVCCLLIVVLKMFSYNSTAHSVQKAFNEVINEAAKQFVLKLA